MNSVLLAPCCFYLQPKLVRGKNELSFLFPLHPHLLCLMKKTWQIPKYVVKVCVYLHFHCLLMKNNNFNSYINDFFS